MTTTTTWSQPSERFKPLCVNDLRVEAIPNTVQLDNCNTCVTPQVPGAEGGCAPDREIARTVKIHLPFSLQEKLPSGLTTRTSSWGHRVVSTVDGGEVQTEFTSTENWHTSPVPGGTTFSLVIPPYSRPCRRYWAGLTAVYGTSRPAVYTNTREETWRRTPPLPPQVDRCISIPTLPAVQTGAYAEDSVLVTNSENLEYLWNVRVNGFSAAPFDPIGTPPTIWPTAGTAHPDFQAVYDAVGNQAAFPRLIQGFKGWIWSMEIGNPNYHLRGATYRVKLWGAMYPSFQQTAGAAVLMGENPATVLPPASVTFVWWGNRSSPATWPLATYYANVPSSLLTRPEGAITNPPGVVYPRMNGGDANNGTFPEHVASPRIAPPMVSVLSLVGEWSGVIYYNTPTPAALIGGFSAGAAAYSAGPVTLPSTIYLDIGPPA